MQQQQNTRECYMLEKFAQPSNQAGKKGLFLQQGQSMRKRRQPWSGSTKDMGFPVQDDLSDQFSLRKNMTLYFFTVYLYPSIRLSMKIKIPWLLVSDLIMKDAINSLKKPFLFCETVSPLWIIVPPFEFTLKMNKPFLLAVNTGSFALLDSAFRRIYNPIK